MMSDDVVVTENEPRPARPDTTEAQVTAERSVHETIKNLDAGLVSRRSAIDVKRAAKRAIQGHDLNRGLGRV
jgi:hypothetical protein